MPTEKKLKREDVIKAVKKFKGKVGLVAEHFGVVSQTIYNYADRYKTVADAIKLYRKQFNETLLDTAESKLQTAIMEGKAWAVRYALDKKGASRGYIEQKNLNHEVSERKQISKKITIENAREIYEKAINSYE